MANEVQPVGTGFYWLNDRHIQNLGLERGGQLSPLLSNAGYEKQYRIYDVEQFNATISDRTVRESILRTKRDIGFKRSSCVVHQHIGGRLDVEFWKGTVDFQRGLFDDITVTYLPQQVDVFEEVLEYASESGAPLAVYSPVGISLSRIREMISIVEGHDSVKRVKLKYGKYTTHLGNYLEAIRRLPAADKGIHLTFGYKKCNIEGHKQVSAEFIGAFMGAESFCANFREPRPGRRGFSTSTPVFRSDSLMYEDVANSNLEASYREQGLRNIEGIESEMTVFIARQDPQALREYVLSKPAFRGVLETLGVF